MDYEALKDQWSEVEDRDGVRLSWNTFPSSRMVGGRGSSSDRILDADYGAGSLETRGAHWSSLHTSEGEA